MPKIMNRVFILIVAILVVGSLSARPNFDRLSLPSLDGVIDMDVHLSVSNDHSFEIINTPEVVQLEVTLIDFVWDVVPGPTCGSLLVDQESPIGHSSMEGNEEGRAPPVISFTYYTNYNATKALRKLVILDMRRSDLPIPES